MTQVKGCDYSFEYNYIQFLLAIQCILDYSCFKVFFVSWNIWKLLVR